MRLTRSGEIYTYIETTTHSIFLSIIDILTPISIANHCQITIKTRLFDCFHRIAIYLGGYLAPTPPTELTVVDTGYWS